MTIRIHLKKKEKRNNAKSYGNFLSRLSKQAAYVFIFLNWQYSFYVVCEFACTIVIFMFY